MATGWPMKTTYANGDVYSASDVNDITGTVNLLQTSTLSRQAGKNSLINGGLDIWQRGTSFASLSGNSLYTADRWLFKRLDGSTGGTVSRQSSTVTGLQYAMRVQRNNANTGTGGLYVYNTIETINSIPLAGQTITLSFYALKGSNFSASNLEVYIGYGTGTDQQMGSTGFTGQATVINTTQTLTTTATRYTFTGSVPSTATEVGLYLGFSPTGTAGANDYFDVSGVQIELGSYATTFSRAGGSIGGELALCQRYFQVIEFLSMCHARTTGIIEGSIIFPTIMRTAPTLTALTAWNFYDAFGNGFTQSAAQGALSVSGANTKGAFLAFSNFTGLTQGRTYAANAAGQGSFSLSAEL